MSISKTNFGWKLIPSQVGGWTPMIPFSPGMTN